MTGANKAKGPGILGFLPKPVHTLPSSSVSAMDDIFTQKKDRPAPQPEPAAEAIASAADMYRVDDSGGYVNAHLAAAPSDEAQASARCVPDLPLVGSRPCVTLQARCIV